MLHEEWNERKKSPATATDKEKHERSLPFWCSQCDQNLLTLAWEVTESKHPWIQDKHERYLPLWCSQCELKFTQAGLRSYRIQASTDSRQTWALFATLVLSMWPEIHSGLLEKLQNQSIHEFKTNTSALCHFGTLNVTRLMEKRYYLMGCNDSSV